MKRITVSLPDDVVAAAEWAVDAGSAKSVSAYVADAMREYDRRPTFREFLDEWERETEPLPPEEEERIRRHVQWLAGEISDDEYEQYRDR